MSENGVRAKTEATTHHHNKKTSRPTVEKIYPAEMDAPSKEGVVYKNGNGNWRSEVNFGSWTLA